MKSLIIVLFIFAICSFVIGCKGSKNENISNRKTNSLNVSNIQQAKKIKDIKIKDTLLSKITIEKAQALTPVSLEKAQVLVPRGDAVFVDGQFVFRGASAGLIVGQLEDDNTQIVNKAVVYLPDAANDVIVYKGIAFIASGSQGVWVIDVTSPQKPKPLVVINTLGSALRFDLDGENLLVANGALGVLLIDISNPKKPKPKAIWKSKGYVKHAIIKDDTIYVAEGTLGVTKLQINNDNIIFKWRQQTNGQARAVFARNKQLLIANGSAGLLVLNIADPQKTKIVGKLQLKDMARDVVMGESDDRAFVASGDDGIIVIDISTKASLKKSGQFISKKSANRLRVEKTNLYVGNDAAGLLTLNITNPDIPVKIF